ncbi:response regulator [Gynuella sp.]|uniref:response regulator n=1 Tax=Gynuella sp. TaxID=2969146 RepID=UPI003D0B5A50
MARTILVVDDETNIRKSIQRVFRSGQYEVLTAGDGFEALDVMNQKDVGVILSDHRMPNMDGTELFTQIKELYPKTVRIMLTGYNDVDNLTHAINNGGIYKFLTKPWEDRELIEAVEAAFEIYEMETRNDELSKRLKHINEQLEKSVAQQSRVLKMNIKTLQTSQDIIDSLPMSIVCFGDDGIVVEANKQACSFFAQGHALVGMPFAQVLPKEITSVISSHPGPDDFREIVISGPQTLVYAISNFESNSGASGFIFIGYEKHQDED